MDESSRWECRCLEREISADGLLQVCVGAIDVGIRPAKLTNSNLLFSRAPVINTAVEGRRKRDRKMVSNGSRLPAPVVVNQSIARRECVGEGREGKGWE